MTDILIYGGIGEEITARGIIEQLHGADDVTVRVNSPGGDCYEGMAIMGALKAHHGQVTAIVEGLAASAASFILCGADKVIARPYAEVMVHSAWTMGVGNADDLGKLADDLNRMSESISNIYAEKSGKAAEEWDALMRAETWFSAEEALEAGLVDAIEDAKSPLKAGAGRMVFAKALSKYKYMGRADAPAPESILPAGSEEPMNTEAEKLEAAEKALSEAIKNNEVVTDAVEPAVETVEAPGETEPEAEAVEEATEEDEDFVTIPKAHFEYLTQMVAKLDDKRAEIEEQERLAQVDADINAGRFAAALRQKAVAVMKRDPEMYASTWGSLPKGTIPVSPKGAVVNKNVIDTATEGVQGLMADLRSRKEMF